MAGTDRSTWFPVYGLFSYYWSTFAPPLPPPLCGLSYFPPYSPIAPRPSLVGGGPICARRDPLPPQPRTLVVLLCRWWRHPPPGPHFPSWRFVWPGCPPRQLLLRRRPAVSLPPPDTPEFPVAISSVGVMVTTPWRQRRARLRNDSTCCFARRRDDNLRMLTGP